MSARPAINRVMHAVVKRRHVLVADDNLRWREIIAGLLEDEFEVSSFAATTAELLCVADTRRPDIITVDISMPGRSGLSALNELRTMLPDAALVVVSTSNTDQYRTEAVRCGADGYTTKARIMTDLIPCIHAALERHEARLRIG
jgi:DNA-binding NarL/FixJ family response regulator